MKEKDQRFVEMSLMAGLAESHTGKMYLLAGTAELAQLDWIVGKVRELADELHLEYGP
jgi:hypothetical protein